jgi:hypothetical protein
MWRQAQLKSMKWKQWQVDLCRQCGCGKFCDLRFSLLLLKQYILYTVHPKRNIYWQRLTNHIQFRTRVLDFCSYIDQKQTTRFLYLGICISKHDLSTLSWKNKVCITKKKYEIYNNIIMIIIII